MKSKFLLAAAFTLFTTVAIQAQNNAKNPVRYDITMELNAGSKTVKQKINSLSYGVNKNKIADALPENNDDVAYAVGYDDIYLTVGGVSLTDELIKILADSASQLNAKITVIDNKKNKLKRVFELKNVSFNFSDSYFNSEYEDTEDNYSTSGSISSNNLTINGIKVK